MFCKGRQQRKSGRQKGRLEKGEGSNRGMEQGTDHLTGKGRETTKVKSSGTPTRLHREFLPSISRNEVRKKKWLAQRRVKR